MSQKRDHTTDRSLTSRPSVRRLPAYEDKATKNVQLIVCTQPCNLSVSLFIDRKVNKNLKTHLISHSKSSFLSGDPKSVVLEKKTIIIEDVKKMTKGRENMNENSAV